MGSRSMAQCHLSWLREYGLERLAKVAKIGLDDAPDNPVVHAGVAVDQDVAKADDAGRFRNRRGGRRIDTSELVEGLADNLELALLRLSGETRRPGIRRRSYRG